MFLFIMADMPSKPPIVFPQEQRVLTAMGERIRLARRRRRLSTTTVSGRAGISRSTLHKIEAGDPGVTLGSCVRVLACLSLVNDFDHIAADDRLGRKLQDLGLEPPPRPKRKIRTRSRSAPAGGKVSQQEVSVMAGEPGMEVPAADCRASGCLTDQTRSSSLLEEEGGA